jgi:hypothetical protein
MRFRVLNCLWPLLFLFQVSRASAQYFSSSPSEATESHYDGAEWHLRGEGVVACPCRVPCPCRSNGQPSYGHCEATLYLHVREGHYGHVKLDRLQAVETGGPCAMSYKRLAALYLDASSTAEQRAAYMKLLASFFPDHTADFPYVRSAPIDSKIIDGHLFEISIRDILELKVDRNWGEPAPPFPEVAACDHYSNTIQYAQNIRYRMQDSEAHLAFDYSRRHANYRNVNVDAQQYRSKSLLIQFQDGAGWFNQEQLKLIEEQHLALPDLDAIRVKASRLILPGGSDE